MITESQNLLNQTTLRKTKSYLWKSQDLTCKELNKLENSSLNRENWCLID